MMKDIVKNMVKIIEQTKDQQEALEQKINNFYQMNQKFIEETSKQINKNVRSISNQFPNPFDIWGLMTRISDFYKTMIGEDNFEKLKEYQRENPFLKKFFKKLMPK